MDSRRCPHCGYHPDTIPSDSNAYAQANCKHADCHGKAQPAPAPLPEVLSDEAFSEISDWLLAWSRKDRSNLKPLTNLAIDDGLYLLHHIAALSQRVAELEAVSAEYKECIYSTNKENSAYERIRVEDQDTIKGLTTRAEAAEAKCREAEKEVLDMDSACNTLLSSVCAERDAAEAKCREMKSLLIRAEPHILDIVNIGGFHSVSASELHKDILEATND